MSRTYKDEPFEVRVKKIPGSQKKSFNRFARDLEVTHHIAVPTTNSDNIAEIVDTLRGRGYTVDTRESDGYFLSFAEIIRNIPHLTTPYNEMLHYTFGCLSFSATKEYMIAPTVSTNYSVRVYVPSRDTTTDLTHEARKYHNPQTDYRLDDDMNYCGVVFDASIEGKGKFRVLRRSFVSVTIITATIRVSPKDRTYWDMPRHHPEIFPVRYYDDWDIDSRDTNERDFRAVSQKICHGFNNSGLDLDDISDIADNVS